MCFDFKSFNISFPLKINLEVYLKKPLNFPPRPHQHILALFDFFSDNYQLNF